MCKVCACAKTRAWKAENAARKKAADNAYRERHRDRKIEYLRSYYEQHQEARTEKLKKEVAEITPRYVADLLKMHPAKLTPELVKLKQEQITLRRMARQLKDAIRESSKDPR